MSSFEHIYSQTPAAAIAQPAKPAKFERYLLILSIGLWLWTLISVAQLTRFTPYWFIEQVRLLTAT